MSCLTSLNVQSFWTKQCFQLDNAGWLSSQTIYFGMCCCGFAFLFEANSKKSSFFFHQAQNKIFWTVSKLLFSIWLKHLMTRDCQPTKIIISFFFLWYDDRIFLCRLTIPKVLYRWLILLQNLVYSITHLRSSLLVNSCSNQVSKTGVSLCTLDLTLKDT